jgi:hypothetical protein
MRISISWPLISSSLVALFESISLLALASIFVLRAHHQSTVFQLAPIVTKKEQALYAACGCGNSQRATDTGYHHLSTQFLSMWLGSVARGFHV